jgi:hypothetical protein
MAQAGFVLPTTVLLVLMVVLTATALTYRTISRSQMNIAQREQVRVANVASPAVDRAKSKIEFIFTNDTRLTSGLPTPEVLASMMLATPYPDTVSALVPGKDPFTLPGETRLDINGDGTLDNAWSFVDSNTNETVAYSILVEAEGRDTSALSGGKNYTSVSITSPVNIDKAKALVTRSGPVAATSPSAVCSNARAEGGWQVVDSGSSSTLQKNFQINVFVPNSSDVNRTLEAFEFQQSRIAERGNKWAAWFRYDLDISPGSPFTINGAMHTDANLFVSGPQSASRFEAFKISSHNSCVYGKEASEITVGVDTRINPFEGQIVRGSLISNAYEAETADDTDAIFHIWDGDDRAPVTNRALTGRNDSVSGATPSAVAVNPLVLFTQDKLVPIGDGWSRDAAAWEANPIRSGGTNGAPRVFNRRMPKPFVDDLFRADNRWGPKPRYSETIASLDITNTSSKVGDPIASDLALLRNETQGLDGYWERQAIANGLRLVVGQRLDLGNPRQWNFDASRPLVNPERPAPSSPNVTDRLYPPNAAMSFTGVGANEYRQKRSLRDNLAAVQGMVVYHYKLNSGKFPAACMAFTAHPGTPQTIARSRTFGQWINGQTRADFFNGQGTNGWEFRYNANFDTVSEFQAAIASNQPLGIALRNLAYFAGDPLGGAPSFPAVQDTNIHPFPHQAMWGDFSPLRRIVDAYDAMPSSMTAAQKYDALSAADQTTLHSAACTLGLLAQNLQEELLEYDQLSTISITSLTTFATRLNTLTGAMIRYVLDGTDPGNSFRDSGVGIVTRLTALGTARRALPSPKPGMDRTQWMQDRIYNILRTQLAKRDATTGEIILNTDGKLILVNPATNAEIIDGTPLTDGSGNIRFDAEGVIQGVITPYNGATATLTQLATWADQYLRNTFLNTQTLRTSTALRATLASVNRDRPLGGFTDNNGRDLGGAAEYLNMVSFSEWEVLFRHVPGGVTAADVALFKDFALRVNRIYSLIRDRDRGFTAGKPQKNFTPGGTRTLGWDDQTGYVANVTYGTGSDTFTVSLKTNCDPNVFRAVMPGGTGGDSSVGLGGLVGCSVQEEMIIRNPSLYYLFPLEDHSHSGTGYHLQPGATGYAGGQPNEEYITQTYISNQNSSSTRYRRVKLATETSDNDVIRAVRHIAAVPASRTDFTTWVTPALAATANTVLPTAASVNAANRAFSINLCGQQQVCVDVSGNLVTSNLTGAVVSFLDKGIFDGREQLAVRVADLDLARLTSTNVPGVTPVEKWIPDTECIPSDTVDCNLFSEGIVYAFREDAVREDEIVRPKNANAVTSGTTGTNCLTMANITSDTCRMVTTPGSAQDPPLTAAGISLKPVDYYADPDRRPHGFRLRNGADMSNGETRLVGMTFVTDNSVYIMGNFNLHSTAGTTATLIEEFTEQLGDAAWVATGTASTGQVNFYDGRTTINTNFSRRATDTWRPVEILADAFTIISDDFLDGDAEDAFTIARPSSRAATNTSYMNQSRPDDDLSASIVRANGTNTPIWINRNGSAFRTEGSNIVLAENATRATSGGGTERIPWTVLRDSDDDRRRNLNLVTGPVRVNAVLIGGLVPSRTNQTYGGLNNFPRTIQHWDSGSNQRPLIINGSFLQLNFSTASTGPFDQDAWEPTETPLPWASASDTGERLGFYSTPVRRWGYDPGLLYYPPAAASRRFASVGNLRSEYFRDLPADDPYVQILRCAKDKDSNFVYPADIRGTCPA